MILHSWFYFLSCTNLQFVCWSQANSKRKFHNMPYYCKTRFILIQNHRSYERKKKFHSHERWANQKPWFQKPTVHGLLGVKATERKQKFYFNTSNSSPIQELFFNSNWTFIKFSQVFNLNITIWFLSNLTNIAIKWFDINIIPNPT